MRQETFAGSDNVQITVSVSRGEVAIGYRAVGLGDGPQNIFVALGVQREIGGAVLPFGQHFEGSTVFLPFKADLLLCAEFRGDQTFAFIRQWEHWRWSERGQTSAFELARENGEFVFHIPRELTGDAARIDFAAYMKDPIANAGWGWFWGCSDRGVDSGIGDKYISHYHELRLDEEEAPLVTRRGRYGMGQSRIRIYQLFVRLFGNTNERRKQNGTMAENGAGRFADINDAAIGSIKQMGFTHIWLTGVLKQATATDYSEFGQPADDTDLLKGLAGSPYAIKDYFDVCPDYAQKRAERLKEFEQLLERIHAHGLKAIIDLVPNHVARSYDSSVKPNCNFGTCGGTGVGDDISKFFDPHNNFFYLTPDGHGPPLRLPTWNDGVAISATCQAVAAVYDRRQLSDGDPRQPLQSCDGFFEGEKTFGRVTGNNVVSWTPHINDWYETIKLNYGFDFTDPSKSVREYPNAWSPDKAIPNTWKKVDQVIEHWQSLGVDGFRCDMSHMVPPEMWSWTIAQARRRQPGVFFMGEAYNDDPAKVPGSDPVVSQLNWGQGNVLFDLLNAVFNAVYDAPVYRALKRIYDGSCWANDIDREIADDFICHNSVRYAENHDEVRLAAHREWGGIGMEVGRPVSAILYGLSRGAIMLYNGQEVGEPGAGAEGFGGDDARTSIFDYWSMPEFVKWVNDHKYDGAHLSVAQREIREFYGRLVNLIGQPAFADGKFLALNPANHDNERFGRLPGEEASGHWLYAFLRYDIAAEQRFLVVANLHPAIAFDDVRILLPPAALQFLQLQHVPLTLIERLSGATERVNVSSNQAVNAGIPIAQISRLSALYFEFA